MIMLHVNKYTYLDPSLRSEIGMIGASDSFSWDSSNPKSSLGRFQKLEWSLALMGESIVFPRGEFGIPPEELADSIVANNNQKATAFNYSLMSSS